MDRDGSIASLKDRGQLAQRVGRQIKEERLGRAPESFWTDTGSHPSGGTGSETADRSTLQRVRAFQRIGDAKLRRRLLQLMKQMAGEGEGNAG